MPNSLKPRVPVPVRSPLAGFLSYLVPGLGQIYQGRIGKGLLFMVCLYGLFFAGMAQGSWKNVYLPDTSRINPPPKILESTPPLGNLYNRLQFAGQFWIGIAAWPAIYHYNTFDERRDGRNENASPLANFEKTPPEEELNRLQRDGDKTWDLGWVYTVIAGVLNILVIYDAFAGPAFAEGELLQRSQTEIAPS